MEKQYKHPLIDAIRSRNETEIVNILDDAVVGRERSKEKDKHQRCPLFYGIIMKYNYRKVLRKIINYHPNIVKEKDRWGDYKLFTALRHNCNDFELISKLVEVFPTACNELDSQHLYAFSVAIMIKKKPQAASTNVIKLILEHSNVENVCKCFILNWSPIAYALKYLIPSLSIEIFLILVNNSPIEFLMESDIENVPPIRRVLSQTCKWKSDCEQALVLQTLIEKSNGLIRFDEEDNYGRTMVHCAALYKVGVKVMNVLIDANPKMLIQRDHEGRLPLHLALRAYILLYKSTHMNAPIRKCMYTYH